MQQVILNHYVNECRIYLSLSQIVCTVLFGANENNAVNLPHSAKRKHAFLGKIKEMSKKNKLSARKWEY